MSGDFSVWVDADSCPREVRTFLISSAEKNRFHLNFVANAPIPSLEQTEACKAILCEKGKDSADNHIFSSAEKNDIVITKDIPFAARLVEKEICVMNDRGTIFTKYNIQDRLMERNFNLNLAEIGFGSKNKKVYYGKKELTKFTNCFLAEVQKRLSRPVQ